MLVTEPEIATLARLVQSRKVLSPMLVTELGIVMLTRLVQRLRLGCRCRCGSRRPGWPRRRCRRVRSSSPRRTRPHSRPQ